MFAISEDASPARKKGYRLDIDGLRAVAVLLVLAFHFDLVNGTDAGFIGVDIFFVISGYLISGIVRRDLDKGKFSFADFYARRVRRLVPALAATQLLTFAGGLLILFPHEMMSLVQEILASQFYVSNVFYWRTVNYFGANSETSFMLHTWSLSVEEQFYIIFPAFVALVHRFRRDMVLPAFVLLLIVSFALNLMFMVSKPEATFYLLPTRAWEFAVGALIPIGSKLVDRWTHSLLLTLTGGLLVIAAVVFYAPTMPYPGTWALLPVFGAAALIAAGERADSPSHGLLGMPILVWIGRLSYSLYLVHWPVKVFFALVAEDYDLSWRWAGFGSSFLLAYGLNRWVENPLRRSSPSRSPRHTAAAYGLTLAGLASIFWLTVAEKGFPARFTPQVDALAASAVDRDLASIACEWTKTSRQVTPCPIGVPGVAPTWLLVGDSHAAALSSGMSEWLRERRQAGVLFFSSGCLPVPESGDEVCRRFNDKLDKLIEANPNLVTVILASPWQRPIEPGYTDEGGQSVNGTQALLAFDRTLGRRLEKFSKLRRRTIIWDPVPGARKPVGQTMARDMLLARKQELRFRSEDYLRTFGPILDSFDRHSPLIAARIQSARHLCAPRGYCEIFYHGRPLYSDHAHLALSQAQFVVEAMNRDFRDR